MDNIILNILEYGILEELEIENSTLKSISYKNKPYSLRISNIENKDEIYELYEIRNKQTKLINKDRIETLDHKKAIKSIIKNFKNIVLLLDIKNSIKEKDLIRNINKFIKDNIKTAKIKWNHSLKEINIEKGPYTMALRQENDKLRLKVVDDESFYCSLYNYILQNSYKFEDKAIKTLLEKTRKKIETELEKIDIKEVDFINERLIKINDNLYYHKTGSYPAIKYKNYKIYLGVPDLSKDFHKKLDKIVKKSNKHWNTIKKNNQNKLMSRVVEILSEPDIVKYKSMYEDILIQKDQDMITIRKSINSIYLEMKEPNGLYVSQHFDEDSLDPDIKDLIHKLVIFANVIGHNDISAQVNLKMLRTLDPYKDHMKHIICETAESLHYKYLENTQKFDNDSENVFIQIDKDSITCSCKTISGSWKIDYKGNLYTELKEKVDNILRIIKSKPVNYKVGNYTIEIENPTSITILNDYNLKIASCIDIVDISEDLQEEIRNIYFTEKNEVQNFKNALKLLEEFLESYKKGETKLESIDLCENAFIFKTPYYETVKLQIRLISLDYYECHLRRGRNFVCRVSVPIDFKNEILTDLVRLKADYE
jgi:hypothetical protein